MFDSPEKLNEKVDILVSWILQAKCTVVHTGAGISTAAGVPDFRYITSYKTFYCATLIFSQIYTTCKISLLISFLCEYSLIILNLIKLTLQWIYLII